MIIGDLNCILSLQEKLGSIEPTRYMTQFMDNANFCVYPLLEAFILGVKIKSLSPESMKDS